MLKKLRREDGGFSLVEVLVALMLLILAVVPLMGMLAAGTALTVSSKNADDARLIAQSKLDEIKALEYNEAKIKYVDSVTPLEPVTKNSQAWTRSVTTSGMDRAGQDTTVEADIVGYKFKVRVEEKNPEGKAQVIEVFTARTPTTSTEINGVSEDF